MSKDTSNLQSFAQVLHKNLARRLPGRGITLSDVQESLGQATGAGPWNVAVALQARLFEKPPAATLRDVHIHLVLEDGSVHRFDGVLTKSKVKLTVDSKLARSALAHVLVTAQGVPDSVKLSEQAWRTLVHNRAVEHFVRLVAVGYDPLSQAAAEVLGRELEDEDEDDDRGPGVMTKVYAALATRDGATEHCVVYGAICDEDTLLEEAEASNDWEINDGNPTDYPYFGSSVEDDVEELSICEYLSRMICEAQERREGARKIAALQLVRQLASLDLSNASELQRLLVRAADIAKE